MVGPSANQLADVSSWYWKVLISFGNALLTTTCLVVNAFVGQHLCLIGHASVHLCICNVCYGLTQQFAFPTM